MTSNCFDDISVGMPKVSRLGMKFMNVVTTKVKSPVTKKITDSKVVFEPNVYNGTGDEPRKGILIDIPEEAAKEIESLENYLRIQAEVHWKIRTELWISCIRRDADNGTVRLKAKIVLAGDSPCEFLGPEDTHAQPSSFRGLPVSFIVLVKSIYVQRNAAGLMLDVVAMRYGSPPPPSDATTTRPSYGNLLWAN